MTEIISIHIGKAGIRIGEEVIKRYYLEHELNEQGLKIQVEPHYLYDEKLQSFFDLKDDRYVFRSINIEFKEKIQNFEDGILKANPLIEDFEKQLLKLAESCQNLEGFILYIVLGGSSSALLKLILSLLKTYFPKQVILCFPIIESWVFNEQVRRNTLLAIESLIENCDLCVLIENSKIAEIITKQYEIKTANIDDINFIIKTIIANITRSLRMDCPAFQTMKELQQNLIPRPKLNLIVPSFAPMVSERITRFINASVDEITETIIQPYAALVHYNENIDHKFLASTLLYQGDFIPKDISKSFNIIRQRLQSFDWSIRKLSLNYLNRDPEDSYEYSIRFRQLTMLANTTRINDVLLNLLQNDKSEIIQSVIDDYQELLSLQTE